MTATIHKGFSSGASAIRYWAAVRILVYVGSDINQVPSWVFRNRRKSFTPRLLAKILWDFAYLCWANSIKQKLAAVRMLYDFLVVRQITPSNPAHSVRGPKYVVKIGKTPVWSREDAKTLLDWAYNPTMLASFDAFSRKRHV